MTGVAAGGRLLRFHRSDAADYAVRDGTITVEIQPRRDRRYLTEFIGRGGRVVASVAGPRAEHRVRGTEGYIRARVTDSSGNRAWMQPVMLR